ncbi:hypothetical protein [Streptacidiphilus anmyonensis]|uniref:hypothetical protein n=1 Tax=Streptacidiphilus anmyonensis TaxID=405782 RepID=UPI0005A85F5E|nr:hypothetical protein [Streptacidiphilus anmyonensis]
MTTPQRAHIRRWHQYRADQGRGDPILGPAGTYRVLDDRVLAWVDQTAFRTTDLYSALSEAARHTRLRQITLIGPSSETQRVYNALHDWWDAVIPPEPPKPKPAKAPKTHGPHPRCGRPRKDGQPCQQYTGHGADDPLGPCRAHGGSTVGRHRRAEEMVEAALRWTELLSKAREAPLATAEEVERIKSARTLLAYQLRAKRHPPPDRGNLRPAAL